MRAVEGGIRTERQELQGPPRDPPPTQHRTQTRARRPPLTKHTHTHTHKPPSPSYTQLLTHAQIVLHPLPRVTEIHTSVDALPNARFFQQVGYGVVMRMALLGLACNAKM